MDTIRDYNVTVHNITADIVVNDKSKTSYATLPTLKEIFNVTGEPVEVINLEYCFANCHSLTKAPIIPVGVTNMNHCFYGCSKLAAPPTIPNSVTDMSGCFYGCSELATPPTIPNSVTDMYDCFTECSSLIKAPTIPNSVTDMGYCFSKCRSLEIAPTIPSSVTNMQSCFSNCGSLVTAPIIPSGVTNMRSCFDTCTLLTNAPTIPNSVTNMWSCFSNCTSLTTAPTIPNSVTNIGNCFNQCEALTTAPTIPNSVTNMNYCFNGCTALTGKITINANPSTYTNCMADTQKEIILVGSSAQLQNIANTATNNNVYVWSLSINFSAERQEDDFSKANISVIINRFRNNNESVSLTFTMDGVEGTPRQVTMDTATKTYTSVFHITPSSIVELSVIAEDSYGKSAPKSITLPIPFYTIDFKAGGMEVAVGAPANDDTTNRPYGLFKCGMDLVVTRLVGEIKMWAGDNVPDGWLLCDGSEISKTDYPYLYASIGDLWGTPNISSNFKLPDLTGRVPVGYNSADTDTTETFGQVGAIGGARGAWYHTHTIGSSGAHHHASQGRMEGSGSGANIFESYNGASKTRSVNVPRTGDNGAHTHSPGASGSAGNKLAVDKANMPPYAVVKYIICAF